MAAFPVGDGTVHVRGLQEEVDEPRSLPSAGLVAPLSPLALALSS